uniref:Uncharacterized protein n=1 Tax=Anguilla anguilla TaxID=7936 RepID=A0A0E9UP56_ANGAN
MKHWSCIIPISNNNSIRRICASMRTDIILRCYSNYQPTICRPICGELP